MAEAATLVYDATDKILGRLASQVAKQLMVARKAGNEQRVIIYNAEHAVVSGPRTKVLADYDSKYKLNHPRKGPFYPRMPDQILKRTVRGMLPYQKNSSGRGALRDLRVMIGKPANLAGEELPDGRLGRYRRNREAPTAQVRPTRRNQLVTGRRCLSMGG